MRDELQKIGDECQSKCEFNIELIEGCKPKEESPPLLRLTGTCRDATTFFAFDNGEIADDGKIRLVCELFDGSYGFSTQLTITNHGETLLEQPIIQNALARGVDVVIELR